MKKLMYVLVALCLVITGCMAKTGTIDVLEDPPSDYDKDALQSAYKSFAFNLTQKAFGEEDTDNGLISPASVYFALALAAAGAGGDTLTQMTTLMGEKSDAESLQGFASEWFEALNAGETEKVNAADGLWLDDVQMNGTVKDSYISYVQNLYSARVVQEAFDTSTVKDINHFVYKQTDKMIEDIVDDTIIGQAAVLVNALAFEGAWKDQYVDGQIADEDFTNADGTKSTVKMMQETGSGYLSSDKATGFLKYYESGDYAFMAILPNESVSARDFLKSFSADDYTTLYESESGDYDVDTKLPQFTYDDGMSLKASLEALGMSDAMDAEKADFTGISEQGLSIGDVAHKTHIELDENGTKAAAVTSITMETTSLMPEEKETKQVYLDRPFVYVIVDMDGGLPVFIGCVDQM